jgi:hypothetical protein
MLWLANLIFAGHQIHYVQLRIHPAKIEGLPAKLACGWAFAVGQAVMTAMLTVASMTRLLPEFASWPSPHFSFEDGSASSRSLAHCSSAASDGAN